MYSPQNILRSGVLTLVAVMADGCSFHAQWELGSGLAIQHLEERGGPPAGLSFVSRISSFARCERDVREVRDRRDSGR